MTTYRLISGIYRKAREIELNPRKWTLSKKASWYDPLLVDRKYGENVQLINKGGILCLERNLTVNLKFKL